MTCSMYYSIVAMCAVLMVYFFEHVILRSFTATIVERPPFLYVPDGGSRFLKCSKNRYLFWGFHH